MIKTKAEILIKKSKRVVGGGGVSSRRKLRRKKKASNNEFKYNNNININPAVKSAFRGLLAGQVSTLPLDSAVGFKTIILFNFIRHELLACFKIKKKNNQVVAQADDNKEITTLYFIKQNRDKELKWNCWKLGKNKKIELKTEFFHLICPTFRHFIHDFFSG